MYDKKNLFGPKCHGCVFFFVLGDANISMSATYCNDHDWGDNDSYDLENLFKSHDEYACDNTIIRFGRVSTLHACGP